MPEPLSNFALNGSLIEPNPAPAPTLEVTPGSLPERVDLRQFCSPVENQGKTRSCVANAVVSALELHQIKAGMPLTDMSRLFVYYNSRALAGRQNVDGGTFVQHAMASLLALGCCEEKLWPFNPAMINTKPTQACYMNASSNQALQFARSPHGQGALSVLAEGLPLVFSLFAPVPYYVVAAKTGTMPRPDQIQTPPVPVGHAMLIVGYDLADRTYLVRNSFGTDFGENGYCRIPFETLDVWGAPTEYWTIGAIEKTAGFKLTGPSMTDTLADLGATGSDDENPASGLDKMRSDLRSRMSSDLETSKRDFRSRLRGK